MITEITLRRYGDSLVVTFPRAMTDRLNLTEGDRAYLVETEDGMLITPHDPNFARAMRAGKRITTKHENALRELAG
jgi:antitoxin MazE